MHNITAYRVWSLIQGTESRYTFDDPREMIDPYSETVWQKYSVEVPDGYQMATCMNGERMLYDPRGDYVVMCEARAYEHSVNVEKVYITSPAGDIVARAKLVAGYGVEIG